MRQGVSGNDNNAKFSELSIHDGIISDIVTVSSNQLEPYENGLIIRDENTIELVDFNINTGRPYANAPQVNMSVSTLPPPPLPPAVSRPVPPPPPSGPPPAGLKTRPRMTKAERELAKKQKIMKKKEAKQARIEEEKDQEEKEEKLRNADVLTQLYHKLVDPPKKVKKGEKPPPMLLDFLTPQHSMLDLMKLRDTRKRVSALVDKLEDRPKKFPSQQSSQWRLPFIALIASIIFYWATIFCIFIYFFYTSYRDGRTVSFIR